MRGSLAKLVRMMFCSLITIDVHARDIVTDLLAAGVTTSTSFEWQRQLRYYWDDSIDNCVVHMSTSRYIYGYEYLGASPRLVITPLTDRCVDFFPPSLAFPLCFAALWMHSIGFNWRKDSTFKGTDKTKSWQLF